MIDPEGVRAIAEQVKQMWLHLALVERECFGDELSYGTAAPILTEYLHAAYHAGYQAGWATAIAGVATQRAEEHKANG